MFECGIGMYHLAYLHVRPVLLVGVESNKTCTNTFTTNNKT
jgi:hypothetical protein